MSILTAFIDFGVQWTITWHQKVKDFMLIRSSKVKNCNGFFGIQHWQICHSTIATLMDDFVNLEGGKQ